MFHHLDRAHKYPGGLNDLRDAAIKEGNFCGYYRLNLTKTKDKTRVVEKRKRRDVLRSRFSRGNTKMY